MKKEKEEFISLREAAEMTGYTADYIGQLIRGGKLPGKQVFSNVSWVTTKDAVLEYTKKDKKNTTAPTSTHASFVERMTSLEGLSKLFSIAGWAVVVVLSVFVILFAYIFAVSVDHRINASYLEQIQYAR